MPGDDNTQIGGLGSMNTEIDVDDWKAGTEAIGLCMICGGEYESTDRECPDCHVSLSVVRRCPKCRRVVSAQHTKCVYCRTPFTHELPANRFAAEAPAATRPRMSKGKKRFRAAAVSIVTFVTMFVLGLIFLRETNRVNTPVHVIAESYLLRPVELRHAPSMGSSLVDQVAAGTKVNLTGYQSGEEGQRWVALDWKNAVAYAPADDLAAPKALDTEEGAKLLKFYLSGMETAEEVDDAVKSVNYYVKAFPGDIHSEEIRWVLAERIRYLSQHGGSEDATLRHLAQQQYEQLEKSKGSYAEKAHDAAAEYPSVSASSGSGAHASAHLPVRKVDELQVVGGSGTQTSSVKSGPHEVLVLQAEVIVLAGKPSQWTAGAVVSGRVAHPVKTNGVVAIPAGAQCQLTVVRGASSEANVSLGLTSIEIDHRTYAVRSPAVQAPSSKGAQRNVDHTLVFHLQSPLVIER